MREADHRIGSHKRAVQLECRVDCDDRDGEQESDLDSLDHLLFTSVVEFRLS